MKELKLNEYLNSYSPDYAFPIGTRIGNSSSWVEYEFQGTTWTNLTSGSSFLRSHFDNSFKITLLPKELMADQIKVGMLVTDCRTYVIPTGTIAAGADGYKWQFQADKLWHSSNTQGWSNTGYNTSSFGQHKIISIPNETPVVKELKVGTAITEYPAGYKFPQGTVIFDGYGKYTYNHGVWLGNNGAQYGKDAFQGCWKIHSWPDMKTAKIPAETSAVTEPSTTNFRCIACGKNRQLRYLSTTANTCNYCFKEPTKDIMTTTSTAISPFSATFNMVLEAGASGAKAGAAAELCDFMVEGVRKTFHENLYVQAALGNPMGSWIARLLLPIILYFLASWAPKAALGPVDAESVKKVCYYAHQGNMTLVVGPITARLTPFLKSLAGRVGDLAE